MPFIDRNDAGEKLAKLLAPLQGRKDAILLALPRGGVPVADRIANELGLPLDIIVPRKISFPGRPEYAIGAITEDGEGIFDEEIVKRCDVSKEYLRAEMEAQTNEARRRLELYRGHYPPPVLLGKTVILVDDGIATGFTMRAAIISARKRGAKNIVIAVPVGSPDVIDELKQVADEVITLRTPQNFAAVGQFYSDFRQIEDNEVLAILKKYPKKAQAISRKHHVKSH